MNMLREKEKKNNKIRVGITHGDINGISYEIIIKTFLDQRLIELFTPIIYGSSKVASYHRKALKLNDFNLNLIKKAEFANPRRPNIINCHENEVKIELGVSTQVAGTLALQALEQATGDLKEKQIDVLVTAPINKKNIQSDNFRFPGHTEYLANKFNSDDWLMLMIYNELRIGVITSHIPLKEVSKHLSKELVLKKIRVLHDSLVKDFNIRKPRIALLGLNPHAGDDGLLGREEIETIIPAIEEANKNNMLVYGPFASDGFFGNASFEKFDAVLATYHDQGMIPFKTIAFELGVNYTAGLPYVRTSPAHGTAYELAGKNQASPDSFRQAIYLALDIYKNRKEYQSLTENQLKAGPVSDNNAEDENRDPHSVH